MQVSSSQLSFETRIPSVSSSSSLAGLLYEFGEDLKRKISVCTPAIVYSYEQETSTAWVRPLVAIREKNGSFRRDLLMRVTVLQHQSGSFFVHQPLNVGDTGWLIASDRDTDLVKEKNGFVQGPESGIGTKEEGTGKPIANQGSQESQNDLLHEFNQGFFIPDKWGGVILPDAIKDSFIIQQINPDHSSRGGFILDKDGTIHLVSARWKDDQNKDRGGLVDIDLRYKKGDDSWEVGDLASFANAIICGNVGIAEWEDENGVKHGGNLSVGKSANIKENLQVEGQVGIKKNLAVDGESSFKGRSTIKADGKAVILDPKNDLHKSDAKFREVTVITGLDEQNGNTVKLTAKKMHVLTDEPENTDDVEFTVENNGGGGGDSNITLIGTDNSQTTGSKFSFLSMSDSNVTVKCNNNIISIGVYYK